MGDAISRRADAGRARRMAVTRCLPGTRARPGRAAEVQRAAGDDAAEFGEPRRSILAASPIKRGEVVRRSLSMHTPVLAVAMARMIPALDGPQAGAPGRRRGSTVALARRDASAGVDGRSALLRTASPSTSDRRVEGTIPRSSSFFSSRDGVGAAAIAALRRPGVSGRQMFDDATARSSHEAPEFHERDRTNGDAGAYQRTRVFARRAPRAG